MKIFRKITAIFFLFCLVAGLLTSCFILPKPPTDANKPASETGTLGKIATGKTTVVSSTKVTPKGALITNDKKGDALEGFVFDIPAGAYTANTSFKISYAPILTHTFGEAVTPISPMITIDNGKALSAEPIYVRVPVSIPDGFIAMGFFYDPLTGNIESMPLSAFDSESVTVSTLHFSSFFISMIEEILLEKDIDSGFLPGVDDWQFVNRGSSIEPDGHCAGQTATAQWYYLTKPDGADARLFNRYDNNGTQPNTPSFWLDDSYGYRLCSVVQKDYGTAVNKIENEEEPWLALIGITYTHTIVNGKIRWEKHEGPGLGDAFTRSLFAYGMLVTKQPQLIGIESKSGGGHAMLVYRVDQNNLYIADPNYPGNSGRVIAYSNGVFSPYNSGANGDEIAKGNGKAYESIQFYPVTAMLPKNKIAQRWAELKDGTIGNDLFGVSQLKCKDEKGKSLELKDGYATNQKLFYANSTDSALYIYRDGNLLPFDDAFNITLNPGNNLLGFYIIKKVNNSYEYVDFKYFNVIYTGLAITPDPFVGETEKEVTFTAAMQAKADNVHYEWAVNSELKESTTLPSFTYTFPAKGSYTVSVKAFSGNKELGKDDARVTIIEPVNLTLTPQTLTGEPDKEYIFEATAQNLPEGAISYTWFVNDIQQQSSTSPTVKLTFTQIGDFTVSLKVSAAGKELAAAEAKVTIAKTENVNHLALLQQNGFFEANIYLRGINRVYDKNASPTESDIEQNVSFWTADTPIVWQDTQFSGTRNDTDTAGNMVNQTISGTVSKDGNTVLTLTCRLQVEATNQSTTVTMVLQNIPLSYVNGMLTNFYLTSKDVQKYVYSLENVTVNKYMGAVYASTTYLSPIWTNDASIEMRFRKTLHR